MEQVRKRIMLLILGTAWIVPLWRHAGALRNSLAELQETQSIHASNDVNWNTVIIFAFSLLLISSALAVIFLRPPLRTRLVMPSIGIGAGTYFFFHPYDTMIVIAPIRNPWHVAYGGALCALWFFISWLHQQKLVGPIKHFASPL
jgi:hypothetical protein